MASTGAPMIPEAIRIEDEVWQEAFETRIPPARSRRAERQASQPVAAPPGLPQRRTVTIKGRGAERHLPWPGDPLTQTPRRRPPRTLHERAALRPDRLAMWAVFLGLLLVLVAAVSAHG